MGAHDYIREYATDSREEVTVRWEEQVEEDRYESGSGGYAGNATTMHGRIRFHDLRLPSVNAARERILDLHEKRDAPVAVSYYLPTEPDARAAKRRLAASEKLAAATARHFEAAQAIHAAFTGRKSALVGCKGCGSRISHAHLVKRCDPGQNLGRGAYRYPSFAQCPVCGASFLSETDQARLASLVAKVQACKDALKEASAPTPGKKIGWAVGGWAAS